MEYRVRSALQGLGLIVGLTALALVGQWVWAEWSGTRARNEAVSPQVFVAFRTIESQCLAEQWPHETVRCRGALDMMNNCLRAEGGCAADEYYCGLYKLGFDVPQYYGSDSPFAGETPC